MRFFRKEYSLRIFATLTGLVFLNLSFFLAELNALEFSKNNKALYETLVSALAGISEEEKDVFGGESGSETESLSKEIDICLDLFQHLSRGYFFTISTNGASLAHFPCDGATSNVHQPPEQQA
jgi:hypothetical protein